jgi:hypothetical protein
MYRWMYQAFDLSINVRDLLVYLSQRALLAARDGRGLGFSDG